MNIIYDVTPAKLDRFSKMKPRKRKPSTTIRIALDLCYGPGGSMHYSLMLLYDTGKLSTQEVTEARCAIRESFKHHNTAFGFPQRYLRVIDPKYRELELQYAKFQIASNFEEADKVAKKMFRLRQKFWRDFITELKAQGK